MAYILQGPAMAVQSKSGAYASLLVNKITLFHGLRCYFMEVIVDLWCPLQPFPTDPHNMHMQTCICRLAYAPLLGRTAMAGLQGQWSLRRMGPWADLMP